MELLDLDALETAQKQVTLKGKTYTIADQTVGQMMEALKFAKAAQEDPDNPEPLLEGLIRTAKRLLPDCKDDIIDGLNMKQLAALVEFASASDEEAAEGAEVVVTDEKALSEKK